jgi:hypothetical protein
MMSKMWNVHGRTESGDEWELQFFGDATPTRERINYCYAKEYPEEWEYMPEAYINGISEFSSEYAYSTDGPVLEDGEPLLDR